MIETYDYHSISSGVPMGAMGGNKWRRLSAVETDGGKGVECWSVIESVRRAASYVFSREMILYFNAHSIIQ